MNKNSERYEGELNDLREKVRTYEAMMHSCYQSSVVTLDHPPILHMIEITNAWSYAHKCLDDDSFSDAEQQAIIDLQYQRMAHQEWRDSAWNSGVRTKFKHTAQTPVNFNTSITLPLTPVIGLGAKLCKVHDVKADCLLSATCSLYAPVSALTDTVFKKT